ncbi:hypothetical protein L195_g061946, partial [Trifolium pratense]
FSTERDMKRINSPEIDSSAVTSIMAVIIAGLPAFGGFDGGRGSRTVPTRAPKSGGLGSGTRRSSTVPD